MLFTHLQLNKDYFQESSGPSRSVNTQQSFTIMVKTLSQACVEASSQLSVESSLPLTPFSFYSTPGRGTLAGSFLSQLQMLIATSTLH